MNAKAMREAQEREERCAYLLWKSRVNEAMELNHGFHPDDLPDCPYADWHGCGWEPEEAVREAMSLSFGNDFAGENEEETANA